MVELTDKEADQIRAALLGALREMCIFMDDPELAGFDEHEEIGPLLRAVRTLDAAKRRAA